MNEKTFEERLKRLTARQLEVLRLVLAGDPDRTIAQTCKIAPGTVRKHIEKTCKTLRLTPAPGERSKRPELKELFQTYRAEWVQQSLVCDAEESIEQVENPEFEDISFISSCINPNFVGRDEDLAELDRLVKAGYKAIEIVASGGIGKTRLVQEYLTKFERVLRFDIAREVKSVVSPIYNIDEWLKKLGEEPGREFSISIYRLREALQASPSKIAVFIDNLETALENGKFIEAFQSQYLELLRVLTDSQVNSVTLITSRERLREPTVQIERYPLKGLDLEAWQQFFQSHQVTVNSDCLQEMRKAYGGNAKAMELFCGEVRTDYDGDLEVYWQESKQDLLRVADLKDLVTSQFDRLETTNLDAYNLLCRLGCYRYQDVPLVPQEGVLCLLWDVPENRRLRILDALKDRGLVDVSKQQYLLHPVIREVTIDRLRQNKEDWEKANRQAAEFWTESVETIVTERDALQALEAYYHYVEIEYFDSAAQVLIKMRANKWAASETLGGAFYRLGLLDTIASCIQFIIEDVSSGYHLSRLYNILGNIYWLKVNLKKAIFSHTESGRIAEITLQDAPVTPEVSLWLLRLKIYYIYNIILCKIDAYEIDDSVLHIQQIQKIKNLDKNYEKFPGMFIFDYFDLSCFAFLKSCLGDQKAAYAFAQEACSNSPTHSLNTSTKGYAKLFLGLAYKNIGEIRLAYDMYHQAISYAEDSKYLQIKAKALTGLGELHRIQGNYAKAIPLHQESIDLLDKIRAKCDLAEAYFQRALTYQEMGEIASSQEDFDAALKLFGEIDAPKQIERVQQAILGRLS